MENSVLMKTNKNIPYISFLQFIGPIFVILGHSLNGITDHGTWWIFTKQWIYIFHMPLFFMISGYLLAFRGWMEKKTYGVFVFNKFCRLIIPYIVWNLVCIIPKYILQGYIGENVSISMKYILKVFITPRQNIWGHTWFLVGLFLVYLLTPLWEKIFAKVTLKRCLILVVIGAGLYMCPLNTEVLCVSDLHKDILFFWMGCTLGGIDGNDFVKFMRRLLPYNFAAAFVTSIVAIAFINVEQFMFIPCAFILLTLLAIGTLQGMNQKIINKLARRSFGIYIMHWPVMLCCRVVLYQLLGLNTVLVVVAMIVSGYVVPNIVLEILERMHLGKLEKPARYLLGV